MGNGSTGNSTGASPNGHRGLSATIGGLVIIGPSDAPLDGFDRVFSCPTIEPVQARASRMNSWTSVSDELIELTRRTSQVIRRGLTACVYLDEHSDRSQPVPAEARAFVCARLSQILVGLADVPSFVALHSEEMAQSLIFDSLGDDADPVAVTTGGYPVWELTTRTMFPGVLVAACPSDRPMAAVFDMITWFEAQRT